MKIKMTQLDRENFKKQKLRKKKYVNKVNSSSINQLLQEYINDLLRQGYSIEQINQMEFKVYYF